MRTQFLLILFSLTISHSWAMKTSEVDNPITGTWKYSTQSIQNDFHLVLNTTSMKYYSSEYFVFEANNKFRHDFMNDKGIIVRTLPGNWKTTGDKIRIVYSDINYSITVTYFFIGNDLVLGQNFNHVIFTKVIPPAEIETNTAMNLK